MKTELNAEACREYIRTIRNAAKRRYANEYFFQWEATGNPPEGLPLGGLSYMAAQAVRLALLEAGTSEETAGQWMAARGREAALSLRKYRHA